MMLDLVHAWTRVDPPVQDMKDVIIIRTVLHMLCDGVRMQK